MTGLILAGGESLRFGRDKAMYPVAGRPMIARVYEALNATVGSIFISVRTPDKHTGLPSVHVYDQYPNAGPLAGLHAGLLKCQTPWLLAVACDMPFLTADVLQRLLSRRHHAAAPIVARTPDGRLHPLCALYPRNVLLHVEAALREKHLALQELLIQVGQAVEVSVEANPMLNINRVQDLPADEPGSGTAHCA